jgi:flagellar basal-body rod protein FlgB
MANGGIGLFDLAQARMAWVDRRQQVLAQNIANADTPGYKPRDVTPFAAQLQSVLAPARTDPAHLAGSEDSALSVMKSLSPEVGVDGNAVSVTDQLAKVANTSDTQALAENLYKKYMGFFMTALGKS